MSSVLCLFATCRALADLDPDDRLAATALERRAVRVEPAVWNDPAVRWSDADVCVIRSTWDYHRARAQFERWLDDVSAQTLLLNPAPLAHWNSHKFYLRELESAGIPVVPTAWLEEGREVDLGGLLAQRGWDEAVMKPACGAAADGFLRFDRTPAGLAAGTEHLRTLLSGGDALVQPYLPTLTTTLERALVFIDGAYSHAVTKPAQTHAIADLENRNLLEAGAIGEVPCTATASQIELAEQTLSCVSHDWVYARVDIVRDEAGVERILELELIEPSLFLFARPDAPDRLADAIVRRLGRS